jgi:hypothetical protein
MIESLYTSIDIILSEHIYLIVFHFLIFQLYLSLSLCCYNSFLEFESLLLLLLLLF